MTRPYITYFPNGPLPIHVGFTIDERSFKKEMKRLGISPAPDFVSDGAGGTSHILDRCGAITVIVCVRPKRGVTRDEMAGLLVHEAVHCWQEARNAMREEEPSSEFEAYSIQYFAQMFMEELTASRSRR